MKVEIKDGQKGEKKIKVVITPSEQQPYLDKAARELSQKKPLKGFRPGKATREQVERVYGKMAVLEAALENIINSTYYQAITENKLQTIGRPRIDVKKVVPENELEYIAEVALLPQVTLGEVEKIKVDKPEVKVKPEEVEEVLQELRNSRATEKIVSRAAVLGDKVEIDFSVKLNGVVIEGGSGRKYPLVLGSQMFIPGFEEQIVGLAKNQEKKFKLKLPKNYKPDLANQEVDIEIKVIEVYERKLPDVDDRLAQSMGNYKNISELKKQIEDNLFNDKQAKSDQQLEVKILEQLVALSEFSDIPNILLENEIHKMEHELMDSLSQYQISLDQYLARIGKSKDDLKKDWREPAARRVKTALVARELASSQKIEATQAEIDQEIEKMKVSYQDNPEVKKNLSSPDFREYLFHTLTNRKVIDYLKKQTVKN